jgi:N-acetyl-gamma-glutamyl-phosphate reductase
VLSQRYCDEVFVKVIPLADGARMDEKTFDPQSCNDTNRIELQVLPHPSGHVTLMATLDNLGKGACGMAIQSLNLMLGIPEKTGLPA